MLVSIRRDNRSDISQDVFPPKFSDALSFVAKATHTPLTLHGYWMNGFVFSIPRLGPLCRAHEHWVRGSNCVLLQFYKIQVTGFRHGEHKMVTPIQ